MKRGQKLDLFIFFSHTHWDHIQGFPFFVPIFIPTSSLKLFAPDPLNKSFDNLEKIMQKQMSYQVFPISLQAIQNMNSKIEYFDIKEGPLEHESLQPLYDEGIKIYAKYMKHPITSMGYKFVYNGKTIVYTGDNEPHYNMFDKNLAVNQKPKKEKKSEEDEMDSILFDDDIEDDDVDETEAIKAVEESNKKFLDFIQDADVLIIDSQYTAEEYKDKLEWGHSPMEINIERAAKTNVKKMFFFHHDPMRTDDQLDELINKFRNEIIEKNYNFELYAAREGMEIDI
jgi:ribonuclease BN (tRNA processing enzyme)